MQTESMQIKIKFKTIAHHCHLLGFFFVIHTYMKEDSN